MSSRSRASVSEGPRIFILAIWDKVVELYFLKKYNIAKLKRMQVEEVNSNILCISLLKTIIRIEKYDFEKWLNLYFNKFVKIACASFWHIYIL